MAIPIDRQCTNEEPCASFVRRFVEVRARHGLLSASLFFGFPYADVPEMGTAVNVVTDGDPELAQRLADELAAELRDRREEFRSDLLDVSAGVDRAAEFEPPVCLLDMGDNVGGGSPADGTFLASSSSVADSVRRSSASATRRPSVSPRPPARGRRSTSPSAAEPTRCTAPRSRRPSRSGRSATVDSPNRRQGTAASGTSTRVARRSSRPARPPDRSPSCSPRVAWCRSACTN